jgi:plasmid stability protein
MKQIKVSLPDDDVATLEQAAQRTGRSLSGETRKRLRNSLEEDSVRPDFLRLKDEVCALIDLVEMQCGHRWSEHPTTARVLQLAMNALFARYGAREDLKFAPGELPDVRLVDAGTDDPGVMAIEENCRRSALPALTCPLHYHPSGRRLHRG